ncbi:MAG: hypothetical protein QNL05_05055 [Gammaproteobacteria bacterium]|nr:hypothetical protein [Gammaproteobacteria bacterium]
MKQNKRAVTVVCSEDEGSIAEVSRQLSNAGFIVEQELEFAGSITGLWDDDLVKLEAISGVIAVEESEEKIPY